MLALIISTAFFPIINVEPADENNQLDYKLFEDRYLINYPKDFFKVGGE